MELYLKINSDEKFNFFEKYDKLGPVQKRIWLATVWWVKRFPCAHPRQSKIAEKIGCSREHVNRSFKLFQEWGWLYLVSRGIKRSKILGMPHHLLMLDVVKREYFKRVEITTQITHSYSMNRRLTSRGKGEILTPPKEFEKFGFSLKDGLKMAMCPEHIRQEALRKAKNLGASGWRPDSQGAYLAGICINMAKNAGYKLDWVSFYHSLRAA